MPRTDRPRPRFSFGGRIPLRVGLALLGDRYPEPPFACRPKFFIHFRRPPKEISPRPIQASKKLSRRPFVAAATANPVPSQETNGAKAVLMHNVWATQDELNASMDRRIKFSHACHADDLGRGDRDRSDRVGCDREAVLAGRGVIFVAARIGYKIGLYPVSDGRLGGLLVALFICLWLIRHFERPDARQRNRRWFSVALAAPELAYRLCLWSGVWFRFAFHQQHSVSFDISCRTRCAAEIMILPAYAPAPVGCGGRSRSRCGGRK
jgi:hypothetical protein